MEPQGPPKSNEAGLSLSRSFSDATSVSLPLRIIHLPNRPADLDLSLSGPSTPGQLTLSTSAASSSGETPATPSTSTASFSGEEVATPTASVFSEAVVPALAAIMTSDYRTDSYIQEKTVFEELGNFKGIKIAVEAKWYLQGLLDSPTAKEPLVSALGGLPFALRKRFEEELAKWKKAEVTPVFVFEGLSLYGEDEISLRIAKEASIDIEKGWELYTLGDPDEAVAAFGSSGAIRAMNFFVFFQSILNEHKLPYEIAAYSAAGHIAQMDKNYQRADGSHTCDMVMGSLELLLFPLSTAICTEIDFEGDRLYGINRSEILKSLAVSDDVFVDALLMTGTSFLPTFPALKDPNVVSLQPFTVKDAINMYRAANKSTIKLCQQWSDTLAKLEPDWLDRYRRAKLAVKHNIHLNVKKDSWDTVVTVNDVTALTGDHHEYIGLQLPQELYHYMIHGAIGPRIMNWLVYLKMIVPPPLDGGDLREFRHLITSQLVPLRAQTIALYTSRLHRAFQHKGFSMSFWFDVNATVVVNHQSVQPSPDGLAGTWRVTEKQYNSQLDSTQSKPGSITFALAVLQDQKFVASTFSKDVQKGRIKSHAETLANTMWRFLHLRGYINEKHELTVWGKALLVTLQALNPVHQHEENAFIAFELLRLDQLHSRNPNRDLIGAPQRGSDEDKNYCLLIMRCASLLKVHHKDTGYTGPLSKNLLAYHSIISAVRETDRDLIEAVVASMFLFADGDRRMIRDPGKDKLRRRNNYDWRNIGFSLPFGTDVDVALGIAVKTWLDDYGIKPGMSSEEKERHKDDYPKKNLPHGENFREDLEMAFSFFTALSDGVKSLKSEIPDADFDIWTGARKYLSERR